MIVLPLLGMGIIIFCLLSFILPFGERFKGRTQKIKGFGLDMEISIRTLYVLIGLVLAFTGTYLHLKKLKVYDKNQSKYIESIESENARLKEELVKSNKMAINMLVTLEGVGTDHVPALEDLECHYALRITGQQRLFKADVSPGIRNEEFQISLKDMTAETTVWAVIVRDLASNREWTYENPFLPLVPQYTLKRRH
jgi:hypothetical protein